MSALSTTKRTKISISKETQNWDQTFQSLSWWKKDRVQEAKVMVVGAGALGNEVLKNLALLNVGHILIVDFDRIEYSNLSRSILYREADSDKSSYKVEVAAQRIQEVNPNIKVMTINGDAIVDIGLGIYRRMDVIIGCLDNRLARLALNRHSFWMGKTWIDGAIENLSGQLNVYKPGVACYESSLSETDWQNINDRIGCPDIAKRNASYGRIPTTPITASIIGAMQVQEALKVINDNHAQLRLGKTFYYEGMHNEIFEFDNAKPDEEAQSSQQYSPIIEAKELGSDSTLEAFLNWLETYFNTDFVEGRLNHGIILEIVASSNEDEAIPLIFPFPKFADHKAVDLGIEPSAQVFVTKQTNQINRNFPDLSLRLCDVGVPALDVIKVFANDEFHYVELSRDESFLKFT